jgi:uncharacterized protein YydD (DUF2326 family)
MIHSIDSDNKKFKKIEFHDGFNVILAERTEKSSQKDSRNGLGKTTLINIIHFCLGGDPKDALNSSKLADWTFIVELDLDGKRYKISRNTGNKSQIFIDGDHSDWPIKPKIDIDTGKPFLTKDLWRSVLGKFMFDLPIGLPIFHPSFGSMISYFIRKQEGFLNPFKQSSAQLTWDVQVNNAYLLDLGWKFATEWQLLRKKKSDLEAFRREIDTGKFAGFMGNAGELEAEKIKLEIKANKQKEKLDKFQINHQYEKIEQDANTITQSIHDNANQNIMDKLLLDRYNASLVEEQDVDATLVSKIYQEAGIHFSEKITKTLDEVNQFHNGIIKNRRDFLNSEIEKLEKEIENRTEEIQRLDNKRAELMMILSTQGALKEYTHIQKNYNDSLSELNDIRAKLDNIKNIENKNNQLKIDKQKLYQRALIDMKERTEQRNNAISAFGEFSSFLYNEFGTFLINLNENGFEFDIKIKRSSSQGIGNMKVFCYDLTLAKIWEERNQNPGFLIHDSMIFDGVDERQRAGALQLAKNTSEKEGFQYICTLNSDMIPHNDLDKNFNFENYVVRTLTDATEDGGLLGIRI